MAPTAITRGAMSAKSYGFTAGKFIAAAGSHSYTTPGTYCWIAPAGVYKVSVVSVGGGANGANGCGSTATGGKGGGGGALAYCNNKTVVPGTAYTVIVGAAGATGGQSSFAAIAVACGGRVPCGGTTLYAGGAGGSGGNGVFAGCGGGGGGAGGYSGNGGNAGAAGGGGGGAGGGAGGGGGGVGLLGQGCSGASVGQGGSGGCNASGKCGGAYGAGGGGGLYTGAAGGAGGGGAVRIIWQGCKRSFPSTNAGNP